MPLAAAGQFRATASLSQNLTSCRSLIAKSIAAGAKILFLPEASDYLPSSAAESLRLVRPIENNEFVLGLQESARQHALPICVGIHEPTEQRERVRNTCVYIDEKGDVTQRYQKVHLFDVDIEGGPILMESRSVEPGKSITPPFDTPLGKLGMLICFDLRFPEISLQHRRLGAQILSYPSAFTVPTGTAGHWHTLLRARAIETQSYVVAPALVGWHNEKRRSYGHSMIIGPWGEILGECSGIKGNDPQGVGAASGNSSSDAEEEICVGEIDLGILERVRREMPLLRRTDVYPEL
ncbi:Carbon-nitrogen hydrolase [Orbilia brochopaga]|uniref:Carbon-nitrogen hydrolase n=1 Tax=Orbilia brochopaga TaxID=3140254 RepID=A0AAV9UJV5_9PEZI